MGSYGKTSTGYHLEDVGRLLLNVEDELQLMRARIGKKGGNNAEQLFETAQNDLHKKVKLVLKSVVSNSVNTLPLIGAGKGGRRGRHHRLPAAGESIVRSSRSSRRKDAEKNIQTKFGRRRTRARYGIPGTVRPHEKTRAINQRTSKARRRKEGRTGRITSVSMRPSGSVSKIRSVSMPEVSQADIQKGILSLVNQGLLPARTDVSLALARGPAPLAAGRSQLTLRSRHPRQLIQSPRFSGFGLNQVKLDLTTREVDTMTMETLNITSKVAAASLAGGTEHQGADTTSAGARNVSEDGRKGHGNAATEGTGATGRVGAKEQEFAETMDQIRGYNELLDQHSLHQFIIRNGVLLDSTPEFGSFKRKHSVIWGPIIGLIRMLEEFLGRYNVPMAYIDGHKVVDLARDELSMPTDMDLLRCIENVDEVQPLLQIPGRRFAGIGGDVAAAVKIQSVYRQYAERRRFRQRQERSRCAEVICMFLRGVLQRKAFRIAIARRAKARATQWKQMQMHLAVDWADMQSKRRVAIHVPSLSLSLFQRLSMKDFVLEQNRQMARLCDIANANVDVVYVSPFELSEEVAGYYEKLLGVGGVKHPRMRFQIIVPENADRFPSVTSLAALLRYSPRAMRKIRYFVAGRPAFLVPRILGQADRDLALDLGFPVLGPTPELAQLYSSVSGGREVFEAAGVLMAPGVHDLYDEEEAVIMLSKLIVAHPFANQWMLRLNHEVDGRGDALFDVATHLSCLSSVRREFARVQTEPGYWARPEVQERFQRAVRSELQTKLLRALVRRHPDVYTSTTHFMEALAKYGGALEAVPNLPKGRPRADVFVGPDGSIQVTATHELLLGNSCHIAATVFPQRSVPHDALNQAARAVGNQLHKRRVYGHVAIDFVAYAGGDGVLRLWALNLHLGYSNSMASFRIFHFLMNGRFDAAGGKYMVPASKQPRPMSGGASVHQFQPDEMDAMSAVELERPAPTKWERRTFVSVPSLNHECIAATPLATFFKTCRLHGISFDLKRHVGTAFTLCDSSAAGQVGLVCVAPLRRIALSLMKETFMFVRDQLGAGFPDAEFVSGNYSEISSAIAQFSKVYNPK